MISGLIEHPNARQDEPTAIRRFGTGSTSVDPLVRRMDWRKRRSQAGKVIEVMVRSAQEIVEAAELQKRAMASPISANMIPLILC